MGVLIGFAIVAAVILVGFVIGRIDLLGPGADRVLSRLGFFVLSPALLFTVLAEADLHALFSTQLPITAVSSIAAIVVYLVVAIALWRRPVADATVGALSASYSNAGNIGLPVSVYVLGDATASVPVLLFQLIVLAPIGLTVLGVTTGGKVSVGQILLQPVRNPLLIASVLGFVLALTGWRLPDAVMQPFELIGGAAVPVVLLNFGMSLSRTKPFEAGTQRRDVVLASLLKLLLVPAVAWVLGRFVFGLEGHPLFIATVLAALPTAQNVFNYAQRYGRGVILARDTIFITTIASVAIIVAIAALLAS